MNVGDTIEAPPLGGGIGDQYVKATIVRQLRDRAEKDFSDGSVQLYPQVRVRYRDGREWNWDEGLLRAIT